jgi:hypothetical protein
MIEEMLRRGGVWFATLEEIARHVQKCIDNGSYEPRIDELPYYSGRVSELPRNWKGHAGEVHKPELAAPRRKRTA